MLTDSPFELTAAGGGSWRVSDMRIPEDAPSHIVASIEAGAKDFEVLWIRGAIGAPGIFHTLAGALHAIEEVVATRT